MVVLFSGYAWFLIFRPEALAKRLRDSLDKRNFTGNPVAYFVSRRRYPAFLRLLGILIWLWAAAFVLVALTHLHR
jgi:hypothetical protein